LQATGINLSAFGVAHRPVVAVAALDRANEVTVTLRSESPFGGRMRLSDAPEELFAQWRGGMLEYPQPIGVDVALDISALEAPGPACLWQLTHRPLDFAFYGDAPVTDRVGEFGVRFRAMLQAGGFEAGHEIIEAMPRATIELFEFKGQYQGGSAHHGSQGWKADNKTRRGDKLMAKILQELGATPRQGAEQIGSEELDAILCALTALGHALGRGVMAAPDLAEEITQRCARRGESDEAAKFHPPAHCAVLHQPYWETLNIDK
jgi:hypothetical protein